MNAPVPTGRGEPLLRVTGLGKSFGGLRALEAIDLAVWPGEVVGLVGDNGAGKSTLVRCIAGIYTRPTRARSRWAVLCHGIAADRNARPNSVSKSYTRTCRS